MENRESSVVLVQESRTPLVELLAHAALRMLRFPVATAIGVALTILAAALISWMSQRSGGAAQPLMIVVSITIGCGLLLVLSATMVMDGDELDHLRVITRSAILISGICGLLFGVPMSLIVGSIDSGVGLAFLSETTRGTSATWMSLGTSLLAAAAPVLMIAWPIHARYGGSLLDSVTFAWKDIEGRHYSWQAMAITMTAAGFVLSSVPILRLLVPVYLAHLVAIFFERMLERQKKEPQ